MKRYMSIASIAKASGLTYNSVAAILQRHGIDPVARGQRRAKLYDVNQLREIRHALYRVSRTSIANTPLAEAADNLLDVLDWHARPLREPADDCGG